MLYIYISGQKQKIKADSLIINSAIEERSSASFIVLNDGITSFQKGQPASGKPSTGLVLLSKGILDKVHSGTLLKMELRRR